jgi:hypothetical protein
VPSYVCWDLLVLSIGENIVDIILITCFYLCVEIHLGCCF